MTYGTKKSEKCQNRCDQYTTQVQVRQEMSISCTQYTRISLFNKEIKMD